MIKIDFSDHFTVMFVKVGPISAEQMEIFRYECGSNENSSKFFKQQLYVTFWDNVENDSA